MGNAVRWILNHWNTREAQGQSFQFAQFTVHSWYISGRSHVCADISWPRRILPQRPVGSLVLASFPFDHRGAFCTCVGQGGLLTSRMRNMLSGQGPASSNCLAILVLEFWVNLQQIYLLPTVEAVGCGGGWG